MCLVLYGKNVINEGTVDNYDFYIPNNIAKFKRMPFTLTI